MPIAAKEGYDQGMTTSVRKGMGTALLWKTSGGGFIACRSVATVTVVDRAAKGGAHLLRVSVLDFVKFRFFFFAGRADVEWISKCLSDVWRWSSRKVCKSGP